jgi:hypothetical protein
MTCVQPKTLSLACFVQVHYGRRQTASRHINTQRCVRHECANLRMILDALARSTPPLTSTAYGRPGHGLGDVIRRQATRQDDRLAQTCGISDQSNASPVPPGTPST